MYFQQITTPGLGCFSYIIGCPLSGIAAVVDPKRDVGVYLELAKDRGMRITHIFETHVHADHISGATALSLKTGADIHIHESAPVGYAAKKVRHGDMFDFGGAKIRVLHTPGHTPNSISLLVSDPTRSPEPEMLLTGDLLFVGDTGRPDLPGEEILNEQIQNLFDSLHGTLGVLPDGVEVYPAHGQGSLCGSGMSAKPHSTLGYERVANPRLSLKDFDAFKRDILSHLPMRPQSFSHIIATNLKGAPLFVPLHEEDKALSPSAVKSLLAQGAVILDLRDSLSFSAAHIPGSIHVDATQSQAPNWVGTVVHPTARLVLVLRDNAEFPWRHMELARIGYDNVEGYLDGGIPGWMSKGWEIRELPMVSAQELKRRLAEPQPPLVVDVRTPGEYAGEHIEGALHLPFDALLAGNDCPGSPDAEKTVICQSGYRAAIAASLLQARGCSGVSVLAGGMGAFKSV